MVLELRNSWLEAAEDIPKPSKDGRSVPADDERLTRCRLLLRWFGLLFSGLRCRIPSADDARLLGVSLRGPPWDGSGA
jgi:hypothetical protein